MPNVVVDTSVSLPATLSLGGARRKLWIVLALGALTYEVEHGRLELDTLAAEAERHGGVVGGHEKTLERLEQASDRRAALRERLPYDTPEDWVAIGSRALFDEYERKLKEIGTKLAVRWTGECRLCRDRIRRLLSHGISSRKGPAGDRDRGSLGDRKDPR